MTESNEWETLKNHEDYEININYPHQIRKKINNYIIKECDTNGYLCCRLNNKTYLKHRLIAEQFIPNPDNLPQIDHINHIRTDNRIENLRWVNNGENGKNRTSNKGVKYNYFDKLPETAEALDSYNGHDLDGVYIDYENEKLYLFNGVKYRELISVRHGGNLRYGIMDIEGARVQMVHKVLFG